MPRVRANSLEFEYDTFGDAADPPVLLVMGLGAQMINWSDGFCRQLADQGLYAIRFDNRDIGLSSKLDALGTPDFGAAYVDFQQGLDYEPPYTLEDMADDTAAIIDALGYETVHLCGASMGGMVVQLTAIRHESKLRSLAVLQSSTGDRSLPEPEPEALAALIAPAPETREETIAQWRYSMSVHNGTLQIDEAWAQELLQRTYDRSQYPDGVTRQMLAVLGAWDRTEALGRLSVPTLVVHGAADPLIPPSHGEAIARAIPGATLRLVEGWGHPLIPAVWPEITQAIAAHVHAVEAGH